MVEIKSIFGIIEAIAGATLLSSCASPPPGGRQTDISSSGPSKFTRFTFLETCRPGEDALLRAVMEDLGEKGTVMDLMKHYADQIQKDLSTESPFFAKLQKVFDCAVTPVNMEGHFHGAVVALRNEAFLNLFNINTLNQAWPIMRLFSPWRGKTFWPLSPQRLEELTGISPESGGPPSAWGANVYRDRGLREKMAVAAMKALGIRTEPASEEEARTHDYVLKSFFFIAGQGQSVNPANGGKVVYQFNYRWPRLKTFPPDNFCIDETVQIAEGLYLGQLVYATNLKKAYDPKTNPRLYDYRNFGYFLLMDDDWQRLRQKIGFDIEGSG